MRFSRTAVAALLLACSPAMAENLALIMTIGQYSNPSASLPGIDLDARLAREIAHSMGVADANVIEYRDARLTGSGIAEAFATLNRRVTKGDNVFIYYSGHGTQHAGGDGACTEGMVAHDMSTFDDRRIEAALTGLAAQAASVVMLNDSCFSGGQSNRSLARPAGRPVAKTWKTGDGGAYTCGEPVNQKMSRSLGKAAREGANLVYVAAASEREVAFATTGGSSATVAWAGCLRGDTDRDRSGMLSAQELRDCAQRAVRGAGFEQTITLLGNAGLPVYFAAAAPDAIDPVAFLRDLQRSASGTARLGLRADPARLTIGRDHLRLSVTSDRAGYLYLLHIGSDNRQFDLLYPNDLDGDNRIGAGTTVLPRASWAIQAAGPAGTSHVMAIVSDTPRDFAAAMGAMAGSPFRFAGATAAAARNLVAVGRGDDASGAGRIAVSPIVEVREVE